MRARNGVWRNAVAVAIVALLVSVLPAAGSDDPAMLPVYEIGYVWPLGDAAYELVRIEDGVYIFASPTAEIRLNKSLGLVGARRGQDYLELTSEGTLAWPMKPGDWGKTFAQWRSSGHVRRGLFGQNAMRLSPELLVWHVEGYEDVAFANTKIRTLKILYQVMAPWIAGQEILQWEIAMWYAPSAGVFVKAVDPMFGIVNFELAPGVDIEALRQAAGVPDPRTPVTSVDSRRRHRDAARDTCGGFKCAPATSGPATD